jgi:hypothetical protein
MKILLDTELSVAPMIASTEASVPKSEIMLNGLSSGKFVTGAILETALKWNEFYLLFTTDDIPFEDTLSISFFDKQLNLLDIATLGGMYTTGSFSLVDLIEPNTISFRFIGDTDWHIKLFSRPFFMLPFLFEPTGIYRKWKPLHYFKIYGKPKQATLADVMEQ